MASRSLVQKVSSFTSSLPPKASRQTVVSPRSFHILVRESSQRLSSSTSLLLSQPDCNPPRRAPCRAIHGSLRAGPTETQDPEQRHRPQALQLATNEKGKKKRSKDGSSHTARLSAEFTKPTLPELVRMHMRRVPQPVTIVTSSNTQTHPDGSSEGWHGATISSFNTVTMKPVPIISFNIKHNSSTFAAIKASERLWVHFLTTAPYAPKLAAKFAKQRKGHPKFLVPDRTEEEPENDAVKPNTPIIPAYSGAGGKLAFILECEYMKDKTVSIGDHVVLFASVADVINKTPKYVFDGMEFQPQRPCLVYADGEYQGVTPLRTPGTDDHTPDASQRDK